MHYTLFHLYICIFNIFDIEVVHAFCIYVLYHCIYVHITKFLLLVWFECIEKQKFGARLLINWYIDLTHNFTFEKKTFIHVWKSVVLVPFSNPDVIFSLISIYNVTVYLRCTCRTHQISVSRFICGAYFRYLLT